MLFGDKLALTGTNSSHKTSAAERYRHLKVEALPHPNLLLMQTAFSPWPKCKVFLAAAIIQT